MASLSSIGLASQILNDPLAAMELQGQRPINEVFTPPKTASIIFCGAVELLSEEAGEEGILFFAFFRGPPVFSGTLSQDSRCPRGSVNKTHHAMYTSDE